MVLVHGQPGEGADFRPTIDRLTSSCRVIAPDRPGWGANDAAARGMLANADWLAELLEEMRVVGEAVVVGHSFGGGVALALALRHPQAVAALVLVGSVGEATALSHLDRLLARPLVGERIVRAGIAGASRATRLVASRLSRIERASEAVRMAESLSMYRALAGIDPIAEGAWRSFVVEQQALIRETPEIERSLHRLSIPVAVVNGARDRVVPASSGRRLASLIPGAEHVVLGHVNHLVPVEAPDRVAAIVERYVRLATGGRGTAS